MRKTAKFRLPALPVFSRLLRVLSKEERFFGRDEDGGESKAGLGRGDLAGGCGCCRGCRHPILTKLAAEGQAKMLASDAESRRRRNWSSSRGPMRRMRRWPSRSCTGRSG